MKCKYEPRCAYAGERDECFDDPEECKYYDIFEERDRKTLVEVTYELERLRR